MKTQTRRIIQPQPIQSITNPPIGGEPGDLFICPDYFPTSDEQGSVIVHCETRGVYHSMGTKTFVEKLCPHGKVGDRLWVRETWMKQGIMELHPTYKGAFYKADGKEYVDPVKCEPCKWKPSIHMPRWASRITLEISDVRVERVQSISEADAKAEGCEGHRHPYPDDDPFHDVEPVEEFHELWDSINKDRGFGWESNPWVWVIEFKRVFDKQNFVKHRPILFSTPMVQAILNK